MFNIFLFILVFILVVVLVLIGIGLHVLGRILRFFGITIGNSPRTNVHNAETRRNAGQRDDREWATGTQTNDVYGKENKGSGGKEFKLGEGEYVDFEEVNG